MEYQKIRNLLKTHQINQRDLEQKTMIIRMERATLIVKLSLRLQC